MLSKRLVFDCGGEAKKKIPDQDLACSEIAPFLVQLIPLAAFVRAVLVSLSQ